PPRRSSELERFHPARRGRLAVEPRRGDQKQQVVAEALHELHDRRRPVAARFAGGQPELEQAALREQRQVAGGGAERPPVEPRFGHVHLALREAALPGGRTHGIQRFLREQGLVTRHEVAGQEVLLQRRGQLAGGNLHAHCRGRRVRGAESRMRAAPQAPSSCSRARDSPSSSTGMPSRTGYRSLPSSVTSASSSAAATVAPSRLTILPAAIAALTLRRRSPRAGASSLWVTGQQSIDSSFLSMLDGSRISPLVPTVLWAVLLRYTIPGPGPAPVRSITAGPDG